MGVVGIGYEGIVGGPVGVVHLVLKGLEGATAGDGSGTPTRLISPRV